MAVKTTGRTTAEVNKEAQDLVKAFQAYGQKVETALGVALEAASIFVEGEAKKRVPVDTGLLKNSITHIVRDEGDKTVGYVGTNVEYGPYQELGTSRNKPHPFLQPAVNENKTNISRIIEKELARVLR